MKYEYLLNYLNRFIKLEIIGKNFIGDRLSALGNINYRTFDPSKNIENRTCFVEATHEELEDAVTLADIAFPIYRETSVLKELRF